MVTHQLQVERRTGKVRRPETDVLPLCHATNFLVIYLAKILVLVRLTYFSQLPITAAAAAAAVDCAPSLHLALADFTLQLRASCSGTRA